MVKIKDEVKERPDVVTGETRKIKTGCGNLYVTINSIDDQPFEVFATMGKSGGCSTSHLEGISRVITLALSSGVDIFKLIKHLKGIRCPAPIKTKDGEILSCSDAIAKALEAYAQQHSKETKK